MQAFILGALQGVTELFPISSLGHSVILPAVLHWHINQNSTYFVLYLVATHFATALVLLGFFLKDWVLIVKGFFRSVRQRTIEPNDIYAKISWLIIIGTVPAGIIGVLLQKRLEALFASAVIASVVLILNGIMLYGTEVMRKKSIQQQLLSADAGIAHMSWKQAFQVGLAQCLALIPGFSRTGSTLSGGLLSGLSHEESARFSFLLATPIIFAAAILKLPALAHIHVGRGPMLIGALTAALAAFLSVRFLTKYFKKNTLAPFALYCIIAGILALVLIHI
jgi:undecaprenyl-diphosphatase